MFIGIGLAVGLIMLFSLVSMNDKSLYFGVRLPIDFALTDELKELKKNYIRKGVIYQLIVLIVNILLRFVIEEEFMISIEILSIFVYIGIVYFLFYKANSKVKEIKKRDKWSGYSENIVVVDLSNRKTLTSENNIPKILIIMPIILNIINFFIGLYIYISTKNELIPVKFGANGSVEEYMRKGDMISIPELFMPFIAQIILTLTSLFVYFCLTKSKNIINGGNINDIKEYNRKVKKSSTYYTTFTLIITSFIFIGLYFLENKGIILVSIIMLILILASTVFYIIYYDRNIKVYRGNSGDEIINRDDDENYIGGMFYNNPNDPSFIVPKRVGIGWDMNYGNFKAKIISIVVVLILVISMGDIIFLLPFQMGERVPEITQNSIKISGMYGTELNKSDILSITLENNLPEKLSKTNGAGLSTKILGNFREDGKYKVKAYVVDTNAKVIKILNKDGSRIYINHKTEESTKKLYENLVNYMNV